MTVPTDLFHHACACMSAIKHLLLFFLFFFFLFFLKLWYSAVMLRCQLPVYFPFGKCGGSLGELGMLLFRVSLQEALDTNLSV